MYTQMMDIREELREGSRDRRIPDDPVTGGLEDRRASLGRFPIEVACIRQRCGEMPSRVAGAVLCAGRETAAIRRIGHVLFVRSFVRWLIRSRGYTLVSKIDASNA